MQPIIDLEVLRPKLAGEIYCFINPITNEVTVVNGFEAAERIIATQGKNAGRLRASKPEMKREVITRSREIGGVQFEPQDYWTSPLLDCASAQIWRLVAFEASSIGQHHCLPVAVDWDSPFDMTHDQRRDFTKWCEHIADIILATIKHKPGLERWGKAFGYF